MRHAKPVKGTYCGLVQVVVDRLIIGQAADTVNNLDRREFFNTPNKHEIYVKRLPPKLHHRGVSGGEGNYVHGGQEERKGTVELIAGKERILGGGDYQQHINVTLWGLHLEEG